VALLSQKKRIHGVDLEVLTRSAFLQYVTDMLPFYLELLTLYLECMARLSEFTIEDISVFYNVLSKFTVFDLLTF
jgi:hypothetical protein